MFVSKKKWNILVKRVEVLEKINKAKKESFTSDVLKVIDKSKRWD